MEKAGYERFGLTGNPFRDLSSESVSDFELIHVDQDVDRVLDEIAGEVLRKENKAVVVLLGALGAGKTERLLKLRADGGKEGAFSVMRNFASETRWVVQGICEDMMQESNLKALSRTISPPSWYKELAKVAKGARKSYDIERTGKAIAQALSANAPALLLLNDMQMLEKNEDTSRFLQVLHVMFDRVDKGVLIAITCSETYFDYLMSDQESLLARVNKTIIIRPMDDNEASLLIAKRLLTKRVVDDMQPLYPFSEKAVAAMNLAAKGNPRELLRIADRVIDEAAKKKTIQVDEATVSGVLSAPYPKSLPGAPLEQVAAD